MPRRIPDYPDAFHGWNFVSSFGSIISVFATVIFLFLVYQLFTQNLNLNLKAIVYMFNPWADHGHFVSDKIIDKNVPFGNTIEFAVPSPVPTHVFENLPILGENYYTIEDSNSFDNLIAAPNNNIDASA